MRRASDEAQDYLRILRRRWRTVLLTIVIAFAPAEVVLALAPRQYEARSELFVSTAGTNSNELLQGSNFAQQRVKSYARAIVSPLVLDPVLEELQLGGSFDDLSERVSTRLPGHCPDRARGPRPRPHASCGDRR